MVPDKGGANKQTLPDALGKFILKTYSVSSLDEPFKLLELML